ncbi:copper resistance protein B, partial [Pseudoalteromonas sp. S983]
GFRVRYEFTRQFAPYIGVEWSNKFGNTADYATSSGQSSNNTAFVAGIKFWF